jgi:hypothetical protein
LQLSRVKFNVETFKTNSEATTRTETLQFFRRTAATEAEITSALASNWTADPTLDFLYPTQAANSATRPPDVGTVNKAPSGLVTVLPNQFLALRWLNVNDGGQDAYTGLDNVEIEFTAPGCILSAGASGIIRNNNGTPANPSDDTFSFTVNVTGFNTGNSGWKSTTGPSVTGAYGTPKAITNVPIASNPLTFTVADVEMPACTTSVVVNAASTELAVTDATPVKLTFTEPPLNAQSFVRPPTSTEPGFTSTAAVARVQAQPAPNGKAKYLAINAAATKPTITTEAVNISTISDVRVSVDLAAYTTSGTAFEDPDRLTVRLETAPATNGPWSTAVVLLDGATVTGDALFNQVKVSDSGINYGAVPYPAADFPFVTFRSAPVSTAGASYARVLITGGPESTSEFMLIDNIVFSAAVATVYAPFTVTRQNGADDDLSNDVFFINANITAELNGGNPTWNSNSNPATGSYGAVTQFGPFPIPAGPQTITITDAAVPAASITISGSPPATQLYTDIVNLNRDEKGTTTLNDDTISFGLTMTADNASTGWTSNIPNPADPGNVYSGNYVDFVSIVADVATMPKEPRIIDKADPSANVLLSALLPSPSTYVVGEMLTVGAPLALIPSSFPIAPGNAWQNLANGVLTLTNGVELLQDGTVVPREGRIESFVELENIGELQVTADLIVRESSLTSNFEADDTVSVKIWWLANGEQVEYNMIDPFDSNGNEMLNGYNDIASRPYNTNRLLDEFNLPSPGVALNGFIDHTFKLKGTIPANADSGGLIIDGANNSTDELFILQNVFFFETGANPAADGDGDGVTNADEDIMGTDKTDAKSVLRLTQVPGNPAQFTFNGAPGRFYRVYRSDDADEANHLQKWVDAQLPTLQGVGPHTIDVSTQPGESRRYFRVHVRQADGNWPATVP